MEGEMKNGTNLWKNGTVSYFHRQKLPIFFALRAYVLQDSYFGSLRLSQKLSSHSGSCLVLSHSILAPRILSSHSGSPYSFYHILAPHLLSSHHIPFLLSVSSHHIPVQLRISSHHILAVSSDQILAPGLFSSNSGSSNSPDMINFDNLGKKCHIY